MIHTLADSLRAIYTSRSLLKSLITKSFLGKYRRSYLGLAWHFLAPLIMLIVYYIAFSQLRTESMPEYWIFLGAGLFPFHFLLNNMMNSCNAIITESPLVKKLYFPREIIILAQIIVSLIVFIINYCGLLVVILITCPEKYTINMLIIPVLVIIMFIFALGYSLLLSSISVYVRDVIYFINATTIIFYFLSPIYFSCSETTGLLSYCVWLNPFTYFLESFHSVVYYGQLPELNIVAICLLMAIVVLLFGYVIFDKLKNGFAERL